MFGRIPLFHFFAAASALRSLRILQVNDDGWAELNARTFNAALRDAGHDAILVAPAVDYSRNGRAKSGPKPVKGRKCMYSSCPEATGPTGSNKTMPHLHWINGSPHDAYMYGMYNVSRRHWGQDVRPDLVVLGVNNGNNVWWDVPEAGHTGVVVPASGEDRIPAISFAANTGARTPWNARGPETNASYVWALAATRVVNHLADQPPPVLPMHVWLNINLPKVGRNCTTADDFKFIATRMSPAVTSPLDPELCWTTRWPNEWYVKTHPGCYTAITPAEPQSPSTLNDERVVTTLEKLKGLITCLPESLPGQGAWGPKPGLKGPDRALPWEKEKLKEERKKQEQEKAFDDD